MSRVTMFAGALALVGVTAMVAAEEPAAERVAVGDTAPAFTLAAIGGAEHTLAELRGEARAVLVFFRGAW